VSVPTRSARKRAAEPARRERAGALPRAGLRAAGALAGLAAACLAATGCGSHSTQKATTAPRLTEPSHQVAHPAPTGLRTPARPAVRPATRCARPFPVGSSDEAYAGTVVSPVTVWASPGSGRIVTRLQRLDLNGLPTVVAVIGARTGASCKPAWYRVALSVLPNGTTGWVAARKLHVYRVASRIVVNLTTRQLSAFRSGKLVLRTTVGVGSADTPTPVGRFFVNERYRMSSPDGPFGPNVLGISAHSEVLQHVWAEDGPIALHGTNVPSSIGQAASHGCIHVPNDLMRQLFVLAPDGTPVIIKT
jgi:lipoprotein-anchoring transpeptidase ErfK/SrfK